MVHVSKDAKGAGESRVIVSAEDSFSPRISVEQEAEKIEVWGSVSFLIFLFVWSGPKSIRPWHPHSGWIFIPQLIVFGNALTDTPRNVSPR